MSAPLSAPVSAVTAPPARAARRSGPLVLLRSTGVPGMASAAVIALATLAAIFGSWLAPYDSLIGDPSMFNVGPTGGHLLGYDAVGRDVLSRLLAGAASSMIGPLVVVLLSLVAGTLVAVTAAWLGGAVDAVISSALDILFAFPGILLAILATAVFGSGLTAASVALSVAYLPYVARVLRGAALRERTKPYVAALEVQGASAVAICLRHIVPNLAAIIVAQGTVMFGYAMVDLAAISFLGLGVQPPAPNWGVMISENKQAILEGWPLAALAAGACVVAVVIAFNVLGERLFERSAAGIR